MSQRRVFLRQGGLAMVALGFAPTFLVRTALAPAARRPVLVTVFMRGGVDGLGMVVPFGEEEYYRLRPSIAVRRPGTTDAALDLDGFFGLHPRMAPLLPWWQRGHLGIVHACGLPGATLSHFAAQDGMHEALTAALRGLDRRCDSRAGWLSVRGEHGGQQVRDGAGYPRSPFGRTLRQVALLIKTDAAPGHVHVETCGWDDHVDEGAATGQLAARLDDFSRGLAALATHLGDHLADVVILTLSEFGRTVGENDTHGTDHGQGSAMLLLGGPVRGGEVYGRWPGLARERQTGRRALAVATDVRSVCGEVAVRHLGIDWTPPACSGDDTFSGRFPGCLRI